jgi:pyridoxamine 5'-phosphate oxidase family protein
VRLAFHGTGYSSSTEWLHRKNVKMSVFTPAEIAYLQSQRLGRIATSGPGGQPHVVPVSFRYNPDEDTIDVGGHGFAQRKKYRDVQRNPRVAIVIDDLATVDPWRPRLIEIRGVADILPSGGEAIGPGFDPHIFRIRPRRIVSIGIDGPEPFSSNARSVS